MKKLINITLVAAAVLTIGSCDKKLDLLPQNNITLEQIKTEEDVKALLGGAYSLMQSASAFGEEYQLASDLLASENQIDWVGTFTSYRELQNKTQNSTTSQASALWRNAYRTIATVNTVLDKVSLVSEDERDAIAAEAKLIRGITYFELVNFFALPYSAGNASGNLGVPITLTPNYGYDGSKDKPARATVEAVYQQIIADMTDAATNLPEENIDYRLGRYAANAFLSRVYLNMGDYTNAASNANTVINSGLYSLTPSYGNAFNGLSNTVEDVFAIQQTAQSNAGTTNGGLTTFYSPQPAGRGDAQINFGYFDYFSTGDTRPDFTYIGVSIAGFEGYYPGKYQDFYRVIPVVRLAEMYLTRGEANFRKGGAPVGGVDPEDDLNEVRIRAGAEPLTDIGANDFINERFRELAFEGDRLWTLKRVQMDVDGFPFTYDKLIFPIPQREMDVNENLVQNPGY